MPERIQRKRTAGWKMPKNTVSVTRPGRWGNPFVVGGWFKVGPGAGRPGMIWCQALSEEYADSSFSKIESVEQSVEFYRLMLRRYPRDLSALRGKNLMCWCAIGLPCHADVLLEVANG